MRTALVDMMVGCRDMNDAVDNLPQSLPQNAKDESSPIEKFSPMAGRDLHSWPSVKFQRCRQLPRERSVVAGAALISAVLAISEVRAASSPDTADIVAPASMHHALRLGKTAISYRVTWAESALTDASGIAQATISALSYVRDDVRDPALRPVLFAFGGGPGSASSSLNFELLGPRLLSDDGRCAFADNRETLLDVADLVLIDPVGTGFSRELLTGGGRVYWNVAGDASATRQLIRGWLQENGRTASPIYILGVSYGGYRIAEMAQNFADLNVSGLIMVATTGDLSRYSGDDQSFVNSLPSMAAAAFFHGKSAVARRSVEEVVAQAREFSRRDYARALQLGSELPAAERADLASRMSALIGLPATTIVTANLRVGTQAFQEQLLPGRIVGRLDSRVSAPLSAIPRVAGRDKEAEDPAMGLDVSNVKKSPCVRDFLRDDVGVRSDRDYITFTLDLNNAWDWRPDSPKFEDNLGLNRTPNLAAFMKSHPGARILLLTGYYDLTAPMLALHYSLTHSGVPLDRTTVRAIVAGHHVYDGDDGRKQTSEALHRFIAGSR